MNTYDHTKLLWSQVSIPSEKSLWQDLVPGTESTFLGGKSVVVAEDQCPDTDPQLPWRSWMNSSSYVHEKYKFSVF